MTAARGLKLRFEPNDPPAYRADIAAVSETETKYSVEYNENAVAPWRLHT